MNPILATTIDEAEVMRLVHDDNWVMSQKVDGQRRLIEIRDVAGERQVKAYARSGAVTRLPAPIVMTLRRMNGHVVLDGELITYNDVDYRLFLFDLVKAGEIILPHHPFEDRLHALRATSAIMKWPRSTAVGVLQYAETTEQKARLLRRLMLNNAEGVVFRLRSAPYEERRSTAVRKYKFVKTADCVVMKTNIDGKANMSLGVYRGDELVEVAHCTALAGDGPSCNPGHVVQVSYLYATTAGRLVQPTNPLIRTDKAPEECMWDQLVVTNKEVIV